MQYYDELCGDFADDEDFRGLRVDCNDWFYNLEEKRHELSEYVGYYPEKNRLIVKSQKII